MGVESYRGGEVGWRESVTFRASNIRQSVASAATKRANKGGGGRRWGDGGGGSESTKPARDGGKGRVEHRV